MSIEVNVLRAHFTGPTFKSRPKNNSIIPANIIHTCHVGFCVDASSTQNVMVVVHNYSCKPTMGLVTLSTNENARIFKSHRLMALM